jgi:hypothetical protein
MSNQLQKQRYVGLDECREAIFGTSNSAPSKRTFADWKAKKYFPVLKVGKRVFCDPEAVQTAIERRFKINPINPV